MSFAVELLGVSKAFGAVEALKNVDLSAESGGIHAIVGENGAGKTTLMRVLYGAIRPDSGTVLVDGVPRSFFRASDAIASGIGMVSQHYSVIGELTCLQNLMLGAEPGPWIDVGGSERRAEALASRMGFRFDWRAPASALSPAGAQKLEILKLLWRNSRIMILDEPTAMLSPADSDALFESLSLLTGAGATVILVTHRLPEVLEHCSAVTVLRNGALVSHGRVAQTSARELAEAIVGHALGPPISRPIPVGGDELLSITKLRVRGVRGNEAVKGVELSVRAGEMVGIAGVDGSGQRELFCSILGLLKPIEGSIRILGAEMSKSSVADLIRRGVRLIPEDRQEEGLVASWPLDWNAALGLQRLAPFAHGAWVEVGHRHERASAIAARFATKHGGMGQPVSSLSGGNQQRFVAGRALSLEPKLILAYQPARGLDIDATRVVYEGLRSECEKGAAAIVVSYDLDELLEQCGRVVAMNLGALHEPPAGQERDRSAIGRLMVGAP